MSTRAKPGRAASIGYNLVKNVQKCWKMFKDVNLSIGLVFFQFGLYANPIYKGNWPQEVIDRIDYRSEKENFTKSRLPKFSNEEINYIKGTSDFMAISLFYANIVEDSEEAKFDDPSYEKDMKAKDYLNSNWSLAVNGQPIVPWSARKALVWLSSSFNDPKIFITANGIPDNENITDSTRVNYFQDYLLAILDAIEEDEVKVFAYTAWSLFDSFEWTDGYSYKFGFFWTDFRNITFHERASLNFYSSVAQFFIVPEKPTTSTTDVTTDTIPHTTPDSSTKIALYSSLILTMPFLFQILF